MLLAHEVEVTPVRRVQLLVQPQGYVEVMVVVLMLLLGYQDALDAQPHQLRICRQLLKRFLLGYFRLRKRQKPILGMQCPLRCLGELLDAL